MAASNSNSPLLRLPQELLEKICLSAVKQRFYGPPSAMLPLISCCRRTRDSLLNNAHLYAQIFQYKFDIGAPMRRLGSTWVTASAQSREMRTRFRLLRILAGASRPGQFDIAQGESDMRDILWLAFLMTLESDGKNVAQLRSAGLQGYLLGFLVTNLHRAASRRGWPLDNTDRALATHLLWLNTDDQQIMLETLETTDSYLSIFRPWAFGAFRYPSFHAPPEQFSVPLLENAMPILPDISMHSNRASLLPFCRPSQLIHFGHPLVISSPFTSTAAVGLLAVRSEKFPPRPNPHIPTVREPGYNGPIVADFEHYATVRSKIPNGQDSTRFDVDWARLVECYNPWSEEHQLQSLPPAPTYQAGSLQGIWEGRYMYPEWSRYFNMLEGAGQIAMQRATSQFDMISGTFPELWQLTEHHQHDDETTMSGGPMTNGTFREESEISVVDHAILITEPNNHPSKPDFVSRYETWIPSPSTPPNYPDPKIKIPTCLPGGYKLQCDCPGVGLHGHQRSCEHWSENPDDSIFASEFGPAMYHDDADSDDGYIVDVVLTGTHAPGRHAWGGAFTLQGRVRLWDGLIIILKKYTDTQRGAYVFRGYLYGGENIIGRWREISTTMEVNGYEGSFVLTRRRD